MSISTSSNSFTLLPPSPEVLQQVSERSKACISRLVAHKRDVLSQHLSEVPIKKLAGVLVLIYEHSGELRVLLTTRSKALRTHAGQTALPGGRVDEEDADIVHTALREANEEVALPLASPHIHLLCLLDPFVSLHGLVVTPVVAFLSDSSVLETLVPGDGEVDRIFNHPLESLLDPSILEAETLVEAGTEDWPYPEHVHNMSDHVLPSLNDISYRNHRFRSCASPVKGLTSDILIKTAEVTYGVSAKYERYGPSSHRLQGFLSVKDMFVGPTQSPNLLTASSSSSSSTAASPVSMPEVRS